MPWLPELFSAPVLERAREKWQLERLDAVPYYVGLMSGEHEALIRSFAGEPILHDPQRGRVIGTRAFEAYIARLGAWLSNHNMSFDPVEHAWDRASRSQSLPHPASPAMNCSDVEEVVSWKWRVAMRAPSYADPFCRCEEDLPTRYRSGEP
jgi:hypothetical protein